MASSARMMYIGIVWLTGISALLVMAFVGSIMQKYVADLLLGWPIPVVLQQSVGNMWWTMPFFYFMILISAIVLTWRCYQEVVVVTDYFPDTGVY